MARRFPTGGSTSAELADNRRYLGLSEAFSFARGGERGPRSEHLLARPLQGRMTVRRRHEVSGRSSSWPLRRCAHAGSRVSRPAWVMPSGVAPGFGPEHAARRSGASALVTRGKRRKRAPQRGSTVRRCARGSCLASRSRQAASDPHMLSPVVAGGGGRGLIQERETAPGEGMSAESVRVETRDRDQGLRVELPVGRRRSRSRKPVLFTESGESDLDRPGSSQRREALRRVGR
jgi:hypothetical protein